MSTTNLTGLDHQHLACPIAVYNEDLLDAVVGLTKFQLAHNVYAFYDARFRGASRPPLFDGTKPLGHGVLLCGGKAR